MDSRAYHEKRGRIEAQLLIVDAGRKAQTILDSVEGEVTGDVKAKVLAVLNG